MKKLVGTAIIYLLLTSTVWGRDALRFYNRGLESSLAYKRIEYYTRAIQLDPKMARAYEKRATEYYFQRKFDNAIQDFSRYIELDPRRAHAYLLRGSSFLGKEKGAGIKDGITKEFGRVASHLGKVRHREPGDLLDRAIDDLNRAIEINPRLTKAYSYRAEAFRMKGMSEAALADANLAIEMGGDHRSIARAYATRAKIYRELGKEDLYASNYQQSVSLDPFFAHFPPLHVPLIFYTPEDTPRPEAMGRIGLVGLVVIIFVVIFRLALPAPTKKND